MTQVAFRAPPLSRDKIEQGTMAIRQLLGMGDPFLPVAELIEFGLGRLAPGFSYDICDRAVMGNRHGSVDVHRKVLSLRSDVYDGIVQNKGRDRFTGCHEVAHAVLHGGTLNRLAPGSKAEIYRDPEWQANTFASCLLMPAEMVRAAKSINEIMNEFGVSDVAARVRAKVLKMQIS